jgi:outer membrane receptor protein involved in Fe transport
MNRNFILHGIAMLLFLGSAAYGQTAALTGKVRDEQKTTLPGTTVQVLKSTDSSTVASTATKADGSFSVPAIAAGSYILKIRSVGFTTFISAPFQRAEKAGTKDFGEIVLKREARALKDVTVKASRPLIIQKEDRMVVDVENSVLAAGNSAFQVLSHTPGVLVDQEGGIQLNGKAGVTVMLNNKLTHLSSRDLKTLLEGMSAENVKNIEIINNPSAKYDAEGSAGILNINLKKNTKLGTNGSVFSSYSYNGKQSGYSSGLSLNHLSGALNSYLNADFGHRVGGREATFTRVFYAPASTTYFDQAATGNNSSNVPSVRFGTDYALNKMNSIGVNVSILGRHANSDFITGTDLANSPGVPIQHIAANNYTTGRFQTFSANLNYTAKLDTNGTVFSTDFDYVKISNTSESNFYNYYNDLSSANADYQDFLYTNIPNSYNIYSAKADFAHSFSKETKFEAGVKYSSVTSDNDSRFYFNNNGLVIDPARTNHFIYKEGIYAGYLNLRGRISKKLTYQAGLRLEGTSSEGDQLTTSQVNSRNYVNLFPSLFLQQKVSANYQINYSYSRRIQRPDYQNLNPFIFYRDPYTYVVGNPDLQPQITNSFAVTQVIKNTVGITLQFQQLLAAIREIPILDVANATTIYTTGNVQHAYNYNFQLNVPVTIMKAWETNNYLFIGYNNFRTIGSTGETLENKRGYFGLQSVHSIDLPAGIKMQVTMVYNGPRASGLYVASGSGYMDAGLKKSFFTNKLDVSANISDIFKTDRVKYATHIGNNINDFDQYFRSRQVNLTVRYRFSKGQKPEVKSAKDLDEVKRAN